MAAQHSPLAQFEIKPLLALPHVAGYDLSITNATLFMFIAVGLAGMLMTLGMGQRTVIPGRMQVLVEYLHNSIANMVAATAGEKSKPYFPFMFALFIFILFCNILGLVPYGFTVTSHIIVTFALALFVFLMVTVTGFSCHGLKFFGLFLPHGTPWYVAPFLYVIELVSFCVRPFSLSVRLFANMLAGGILLKVFAGMAAGMIVAGIYEGHTVQLLLAPLPLILTVLLTGFKLMVAGLQAYIFVILSAVYLHDALEMH